MVLILVLKIVWQGEPELMELPDWLLRPCTKFEVDSFNGCRNQVRVPTFF